MEIFPRCFKSYKKTEDKTEELAWDPKEVNKQFQGLEGGYLSGQAEIKLGDCILRVMPEWQALSKFSFHVQECLCAIWHGQIQYTLYVGKSVYFYFYKWNKKMPSSPWTSLSSSRFELLAIFCYRNFFRLLEHSPYSSVFWWLTIKKKPTHCVIIVPNQP